MVLGASFQNAGVTPESTPVAQIAPATATDGFVDLYNGRDLTGWQTKGHLAYRQVELEADIGSQHAQ